MFTHYCKVIDDAPCLTMTRNVVITQYQRKLGVYSRPRLSNLEMLRFPMGMG